MIIINKYDFNSIKEMLIVLFRKSFKLFYPVALTDLLIILSKSSLLFKIESSNFT